MNPLIHPKKATILPALVAVRSPGSRYRRKRERFANRVATPASSTRFSVMMLSLATPPAPETQRLVGVRSLPIPTPALAPVLAVER